MWQKCQSHKRCHTYWHDDNQIVFQWYTITAISHCSQYLWHSPWLKSGGSKLHRVLILYEESLLAWFTQIRYPMVCAICFTIPSRTLSFSTLDTTWCAFSDILLRRCVMTADSITVILWVIHNQLIYHLSWFSFFICSICLSCNSLYLSKLSLHSLFLIFFRLLSVCEMT